ncbi:MAG: hypothetical protein V7782_03065 [Psychromonas sp.]
MKHTKVIIVSGLTAIFTSVVEYIKVSLSGPFLRSIRETTLTDQELLLAEQNSRHGFLGKNIEPVALDISFISVILRS